MFRDYHSQKFRLHQKQYKENHMGAGWRGYAGAEELVGNERAALARLTRRS